jgi:formylglycine-generating enzyme required for sulfatase activity
VTIKPFAMGTYEVTFYEYDAFAITTGRRLPEDQGWGRGKRPVINVSWNDVKAYAEWLSQQAVKRYRLLSESEWEYAARSGAEPNRRFGQGRLRNPHLGNTLCSKTIQATAQLKLVRNRRMGLGSMT